MKNKLFAIGMLVLILTFGMVVVGCDDVVGDGAIDSDLIGKWEWEKMTNSEGTVNFPYTYEGDVFTAGYEFTSNGVKSYVNGIQISSYPAYTQNNTVYNAQTGEAGGTYSISGNKLTASIEDDEEGDTTVVIAKKVNSFSWE